MPGKNLTRDEAAARASILTVESYAVGLDLTTGPEHFRTVTTVRFSCSEPGADTFIDLIAASVEAVTLNGEQLDPSEVFADSRIALPGLQADNELVVDATGSYTNTGEGLHRFVDPVDNEVYLYTQFEVPDSRRMYAVFEQPDLKASFAFTVTAPAHWKVVSNSPTPEPEAAGVADGLERATWTFAPTQRISSYITALIAGPYDEVRDEVATRAGVVPLGIFCRRSLTEHLDADNIFDCTKQGFAFFEKEFDQPYPFEKYDQIFTPEYNMGAMENAGAVTFTEVYVFRSKVSEAKIERRALTILHELAHMWFGNLVTMKWWDDLWLNESFAEWASTTCQAEATEWTSAWTTFGTSEKAWAYDQDQLSSTHPIAADMRHLEDVEVNFDGITYAKGASVLKQLVAYVGREPFVAALREYFAKHAWGNTTLADLLSELEKASGRELTQWSKLWLETAGVNTLRPVFEVDADGRYTSFAVEQSAAESHPTLRPHRLGIGRYAVRPGAVGRRARAHRLRRGRHRRGAHRHRRPRGPGAAGPAAAQRRRPRLREDPPRRALARDRAVAAAGLRGLAAPLARARRDVGHDPRRRDVGTRLRALRARDAARRDRLDPAARPRRPGRDGDPPLHRPRAPGRDGRPAQLVARRAGRDGRSPAATRSSSSSRPGPTRPATRPTSRACARCSRASRPSRG